MPNFRRQAVLVLAGSAVVATGIAFARQPAAPVSLSPSAVKVAQGAAPQPQIDSLKAEIAQLKQQIAGLQTAQKTISAKGFENAGRIGTVEKAFNGHSHHIAMIAPSNTPQGWTFHFMPRQTTVPTQFCKQTGSNTASNPWTCTPP